jgi:tetratricopeptide (TPR) repeat protein
MQFKDAHKSMPEVARELNVEVVVTGAVIRFGDRIRIDTQLIDAQADHQLWSQSFEGDFRDTFSLQSRVADSVAEQLKRTLNSRAERADTPQVNTPAYEALLKGIVAEENTPESEVRALAFFKQAVALDPNLARAYAGIARADDFLAGYGTIPPGVIADADAAVAKALQLDPNLAEAYDERGWIGMDDHWDMPGALKDFQHALELDPNSSDARNGYADVLVITGSIDQGLREMARTRDIDPGSPLVETNDCNLLRITNHMQEALAHCNAALKLDPTYRWAHYVAVEVNGDLGNFDAAHELMRTVGFGWCGAKLCLDAFDEVHGAPGKRGAFDKWMRQKNVPHDPFFEIFDYTRLGRFDEAFASMEKAYEEKDNMDLMIFLGVDASLAPLHSDPRFDAFLRKVGLPPRPKQ